MNAIILQTWSNQFLQKPDALIICRCNYRAKEEGSLEWRQLFILPNAAITVEQKIRAIFDQELEKKSRNFTGQLIHVPRKEFQASNSAIDYWYKFPTLKWLHLRFFFILK